MTDGAEVCERLAALIRAGYPIRRALVRLSDRCESAPEAMRRCSRRAALGVPLDACLDPLIAHYGSRLASLPSLLSAAAGSGSNAPAALERLADSIRERDSARRDAQVSAAGATLSARVIGALPLLMAPLSMRQWGDPVVVIALVVGLVVGVIGYRWLLRAVPSAPPGPCDAEVAEEVAASLAAGRSLDTTLRGVATARGWKREIRRVDLGATWPRAIENGCPEIARAIDDVGETGTPIAGALVDAARRLRRDAAQRFEAEVERAPVKMVIPLACCILPAFVLVGIVPLLRGLALAG